MRKEVTTDVNKVVNKDLSFPKQQEINKVLKRLIKEALSEVDSKDYMTKSAGTQQSEDLKKYINDELTRLRESFAKLYIVVDKLPTKDINTSKIYLVKNSTDEYDEYIYVNGEWERIASNGIDNLNIDGKDINSFKTTSFLYGRDIINAPNTGVGNVINLRYSDDYGTQIISNILNKSLYVRYWDNGAFSANWLRLLTTEDLTKLQTELTNIKKSIEDNIEQNKIEVLTSNKLNNTYEDNINQIFNAYTISQLHKRIKAIEDLKLTDNTSISEIINKLNNLDELANTFINNVNYIKTEVKAFYDEVDKTVIEFKDRDEKYNSRFKVLEDLFDFDKDGNLYTKYNLYTLGWFKDNGKIPDINISSSNIAYDWTSANLNKYALGANLGLQLKEAVEEHESILNNVINNINYLNNNIDTLKNAIDTELEERITVVEDKIAVIEERLENINEETDLDELKNDLDKLKSYFKEDGDGDLYTDKNLYTNGWLSSGGKSNGTGESAGVKVATSWELAEQHQNDANWVLSAGKGWQAWTTLSNFNLANITNQLTQLSTKLDEEITARKEGDETLDGKISSLTDRVAILESFWKKDASGDLYTEFGTYTTSWLSSGGKQSGTSLSINIANSWGLAITHPTWALAASLGTNLDNRVSALEEKTTAVSITNLSTTGTRIATITIDDDSYDVKVNLGDYYTKTDADGRYLKLTGGIITMPSNGPTSFIIKGAGANAWMAFDNNNNTEIATVGYYNNFAFIANDILGVRIGINDNGNPEYWTNSTGNTKYTLLHTGNIDTINGGYVKKTGDTMTGSLVVKDAFRLDSSYSDFGIIQKQNGTNKSFWGWNVNGTYIHDYVSGKQLVFGTDGNLKFTGGGLFLGMLTLGKPLSFGYGGAFITSDPANSFRTSMFGDTVANSRFITVRTDLSLNNYSVINGTGIAWAAADTHGFLNVSYQSNINKAFIGGGNADKLNWSAEIIHSGNIGSQSVANADTLDNLHENAFLRYRYSTSNSEETLWSQIGIKQYDGVLPPNMNNASYTWGAVVSLPSNNARLDIFYHDVSTHNNDASNGIYVRSGWDNDKRAWQRLAFDDYVLHKTNTFWGATPDANGNVSGRLNVGNGVDLTWGLYDNGLPTINGSSYGFIFYHNGNGGNQTRFVANGNVLIGTTTDNGYKLDVNGVTRTTSLRINTNANALIEWDSSVNAFHFHAPIYSDSWISSGGKSDTSSSAFNESAMWTALGTNSTTKRISINHLPTNIVTSDNIGDYVVQSNTYLKLSGGTITGLITFTANDSYGLVPATNNYCTIGTSSKYFYKIYVTQLNGVNVSEYALKSNIPDTSNFLTSASLNGYATQTWVNNKGYVTSSGTVAVANKLGTSTVGSSSKPIYLNSGSPTIVTNITVTGEVTSHASSDKRLKRNIHTISELGAISIINALRPVEFEWNELAESLNPIRKGISSGFIAQEYEKVILNSSRIIWNEYKAIDQSRPIPYLVRIAQSHESRIQKLERQIKELTEELNNLKAA